MKEEIRRELELLGSSLGKEKIKEDHLVPEGYFEALQESVIKEINPGSKRKYGNIRLRTWLYASAAAIIIIMGVILVFDVNYKSPSGFEHLETDAVFSYLDENLDDISLQMLVSEESILDPLIIEGDDTDILENYLEDQLDDLSIEELEKLL